MQWRKFLMREDMTVVVCLMQLKDAVNQFSGGFQES